MVAAQGILTARGGKTSHAAIVAVGMGKPAVCGVTAIRFADDGSISIGRQAFREGDRLTIDGTSGTVFAGDAPLLPPDPSNPSLVTILGWADRARTLSVRANVDTPRTRPAPGSSAPRASASAAPSTCSRAKSACRSCRA